MANDTKQDPKKTEPVKAEPAEPSFDEKVAMAVAKAMAAQMPMMGAEMAKAFGSAMMAAEAVKTQGTHDIQTKALKAKLAREEKCHICGQPVGDGKRTGCGGPWRRDAKTNAFVMEPVLEADGTAQALDGEGKPMFRRVEDANQFHVKKVVFPADPLAAQFFDGVKINNALYWSRGPNHEIWVPRNSDIDDILSRYTQNEVEQRVGRSHKRSNGGRISGGPGGVSTPPLGVGFS